MKPLHVLPDLTNLLISEIRVGTRHRKNLGDLAALATSIENQLCQPIGVTPDHELVWGYRRLVACRDILGWETIPARIVEVASIAQTEIDPFELSMEAFDDQGRPTQG